MRPSLVVCLHGLLAGWMAVLLLQGSGILRFVAPAAASGEIFNWCVQIGYPKIYDWFWYAAVILGGIAGANTNFLMVRSLRRHKHPGYDSLLPIVAGYAFLIAAICSGFSVYYVRPVTITCALLGAVLPWLSRYWYVPAQAGEGWIPPVLSTRATAAWATGFLLLSSAWVYDPAIFTRNLDGAHEGSHLLQVQSALCGDIPGLTTRIEYGPLYTHSLIWWMRVFGLTFSSERMYFLFFQILGTAIHLLLIRLVCRTSICLMVGTWLMLTLSTASILIYGWANASRTALPLLGLYLFWRGLFANRPGSLIASGVLTAFSLLYSFEYGATGMLGCVVLLAFYTLNPDRKSPGVVTRLGWWMGAGATVFAFLVTIMFGARTMDFLAQCLSGGYGVSRIKGDAVFPLPCFPPWSSVNNPREYLWQAVFTIKAWGPAFVCSLCWVWFQAGRWRLRERAFSFSLLLFALLAQIPAVARPFQQTAAAAPPLILLAIMILDDVGSSGGFRWISRLAAVLLVLAGFVFPYGSFSTWLERYSFQTGEPGVRPAFGVESRLGRVKLDRRQAHDIAEAVPLLTGLCRPDQRVYCASVQNMYMCFLADRAGLPPFPNAAIAVTRQDHTLVLAALEKFRPPVVLLEPYVVDVPYLQKYAREGTYIQRHYLLIRKIDRLYIFKRRP